MKTQIGVMGSAGGSLADGPDLIVAQSAEESKQIDTLRGIAIVISASGMASGGRVLPPGTRAYRANRRLQRACRSIGTPPLAWDLFYKTQSICGTRELASAQAFAKMVHQQRGWTAQAAQRGTTVTL